MPRKFRETDSIKNVKEKIYSTEVYKKIVITAEVNGKKIRLFSYFNNGVQEPRDALHRELKELALKREFKNGNSNQRHS